MKYKVIVTDTADALIRKIVLYVAENFGRDTALEKLDCIERSIMNLGDDPYIGTVPKYNILRRQGYLVLILEKDPTKHTTYIWVYFLDKDNQHPISKLSNINCNVKLD